jgi:GNAT superfamily N-acetyltransferase
MADWTVQTVRQRPETRAELGRLNAESWPNFLRQRDEFGLDRLWGELYTRWPDFQFLLRDGAGAVVAGGQSMPFVWDGTSADLPDTMGELIERAVGDHDAGRSPNTLSAMAALVDRGQRAQGLSTELLRAMRAIARAHGLAELVAPVRPPLKASYPLTPMDRYAGWRRPDGSFLDPWLRVHERLGAEMVRIAPCTLAIVGTVAEWEEWTGMRFPDSGPYVVPGALQPVTIDHRRDEGRYEDPNVWMRHPPLEPRRVATP